MRGDERRGGRSTLSPTIHNRRPSDRRREAGRREDERRGRSGDTEPTLDRRPLSQPRIAKRRHYPRSGDVVAGTNAGVHPLPADLMRPQMRRGTLEATVRYWQKRNQLFEKFEDGILLDEESFYSVCPEALARHISERCRGAAVVLDPFCGAGGNAIQLARTCSSVIAMDIDADKIRLARQNASIYGVADRIEFVVGDFFQVGPRMTADVVVLSPPWGGPSYKWKPVYWFGDLCAENGGGAAILRLARRIAPRVAMHLPWRTDRSEIIYYGCGVHVEIEECVTEECVTEECVTEKCVTDRRRVKTLNCLTAYYGPFGPNSALPTKTTDLTIRQNGLVTHERTIRVMPETTISIINIDYHDRLPYPDRSDVVDYGRYLKNVEAFLNTDIP